MFLLFLLKKDPIKGTLYKYSKTWGRKLLNIENRPYIWAINPINAKPKIKIKNPIYYFIFLNILKRIIYFIRFVYLFFKNNLSKR